MQMDYQKLAKTLEGLQTAETTAKLLNISRRTAINYISQLNKKGFARLYSGGRKKRIYLIKTYFLKEKGHPGLIETINKNSNVKLAEPCKHRIYSKKLSIEEAIAEAAKQGIETENYRMLIAVLPLFNKVKNWPLLYRFAKEKDARNLVGALYDVAKQFVKVRKMNKTTRNRLLTDRKKRYLIKRIKTRDFPEISRIWNVEISLNKADFMRLKEW